MRIAQIAPLAERVPPKRYGGTERVIYELTEELVRRGHEVTLFASGDSQTSGKLVSVYPQSLREARVHDMYGLNTWTVLNIGLAYQKSRDFDIIHDHTGYLGVAFANVVDTPTIITMHGAFTPDISRVFQTFIKPPLVAISDSQANSITNANIIATVHNGLTFDDYPFSTEHDGYLLCVGRICMEKGIHYAVQVAQSLHIPLIIAAKLEPADHAYFAHYVEPYLSDRICWIGEVEQDERNKLMSRALCLLHPATWREPFGLTMIEAMATGCPVIGFNRGSIGEVVAHERTGFVVGDVEEMIEAVLTIYTIDRAECRRYVMERFTAKRMAGAYELLYQRVIEKTSSSRVQEKTHSRFPHFGKLT